MHCSFALNLLFWAHNSLRKTLQILPSGELRVEHVPVVKLPSFFGRKKAPKVGFYDNLGTLISTVTLLLALE